MMPTPLSPARNSLPNSSVADHLTDTATGTFYEHVKPEKSDLQAFGNSVAFYQAPPPGECIQSFCGPVPYLT